MSKGYQLRSWVRYRRNAVGRHAIHSPFVFDFIEKCLRKHRDTPSFILAVKHHPHWFSRIINYFRTDNIVWVTNGKGETEILITFERHSDIVSLKSENVQMETCLFPSKPVLYLIELASPDEWLEFWGKYQHQFHEHDIVLISSIHWTSKHSNIWKKLADDEKVRLSIDMYRAGILLFHPDFREKQHFILKYA